MRHRSIYRRCTGCCLLSLFITMSTPVVVADNGAQNIPRYPAQGYDDRPNQWTLPAKPEWNQEPYQRNGPGLQGMPEYRNQRYGSDQRNNRMKRDRFVTPDILRSLNQQQIQNQSAPKDEDERQSMSKPQLQRQYNMPPYGAPPYGMGYSPPVYDMPYTSPWANNLDILYQDESLPLVPNEAIGGIPPMQTPLFGGDNLGGVYTPELQNGNKVFNPFTFIPNDDLQ